MEGAYTEEIYGNPNLRKHAYTEGAYMNDAYTKGPYTEEIYCNPNASSVYVCFHI
jgi:hypothetical protein